ncbi:MAG: hypothetical protein ABIR30_14085 [Chitinophagaceae bacterium]
MSTRLIVDGQNNLHEVTESKFSLHPVAVRIAAKIISYIFHPVFIPVYMTWFLLYVHPWLFAGFSERDKLLVLIQAFVMFTFFPVVTVLLLKALKFIQSFHLAAQKDRIIPLVACGVWYFWIWYVWRNLPDYPQPAIQLALAIWIASALGLMANIIMKVSLHTISMGVMLTFIVWQGLSQELNFGVYISLTVLIAGLVSTARFIVSDHTQQEIYGGLLVGIVSMLLSSWLG